MMEFVRVACSLDKDKKEKTSRVLRMYASLFWTGEGVDAIMSMSRRCLFGQGIGEIAK
jgi:hypothetical protein